MAATKSLTLAQKRELADLVIGRMADLVEFGELWNDGLLADADPAAVATTLSTWAARLPGNGWDWRLDAR